jgi:nucleoside-diphosphate-sugar epimerase
VENLVNGRTMRILITGNMGYLGPVVANHLRKLHPTAKLIGFDAGFFAHCLTGPKFLPEAALDEQHFGDIREIPSNLLIGVDSIIHLAAVSNDPMGNRFEAVTEDVNYNATLRLAEIAVRKDVRHFAFASSCSVYGAGSDAARKEHDVVNPLTAYARSKIASEKALATLPVKGTVITCLRFATACGMSDRLRLDLVLNDFVACALAVGEITVLSDGTPWRPLIDVQDMARALEWAIRRPALDGGRFLVVNVGANVWNYQVNDLARSVADAIPGTKVRINSNAPPDKRSYRVDFSLYESIATNSRVRISLQESIAALRSGLTAIGFADKNFRNSEYIRLKMLEAHISAGRLLPSLRWVHAAAA